VSKQKEKPLALKVVASDYGALNDLRVSPHTPTADRRTLTTTKAIAAVISNYYTPDVLKDKDEFLGVVLASLPSQVARLSSKSQQIEAKSVELRTGRKGNPLFYTYKVYIPELESRCLDFSKKTTSKTRGDLSPLSMAQRIATMQDFSLDVSLYNASEGLRAIQPGTLVKVVFEDLSTMSGPKITEIFKKVFQFQATGTTESNVNKFKGTPPSLPKKVNADGSKDRRGNEVFKRNVGHNPIVVFFYPGLGYGTTPFVKKRVSETPSRDNMIIIIAQKRGTKFEDLLASAEEALEGKTAGEYRLGGWSGGGYGLSMAVKSQTSFSKIIYADPEVANTGRPHSLLDIGSGNHKGAKMIYRPQNWSNRALGLRLEELSTQLPSEVYVQDEYYQKTSGMPQRYHTAIMLKALAELLS